MAEIAIYAVFVACTAAALFAFFWGRRLVREGYRVPQAIREDPAFADILFSGQVAASELELEAPSAKAVLETLTVELGNPMHAMQSPWARLGKPGRIEVLSCDEQELRFEGQNVAVSEGLIRVEALPSGRVRARWAVTVPQAKTLIRIGQCWALFLTLPVAVAVPALIYVKVLGSSNPAIAGQALQVLQTFQVAWEPYLFISLGSQRIRMAGQYLATLVSAAAYEAHTGRRALPAVLPPKPPPQ